MLLGILFIIYFVNFSDLMALTSNGALLFEGDLSTFEDGVKNNLITPSHQHKPNFPFYPIMLGGGWFHSVSTEKKIKSHDTNSWVKIWTYSEWLICTISCAQL